MASTTKETVPHVYTALGKILAAMSVEKNGTLPGNMGGKPYITAVDASAEAKRQFVENNLILLPSERIVKHEVVIHKDRLAVAIAVEGTYRVVSTLDGSHDTFSGSGDGLANGTAVASNIASTNALKNALLRTFLITEQSVEDASKNGVQESAPAQQSAAQKKIERARNAPASGGSDLTALKSQVRGYIAPDKFTSEQVNTVWSAVATELGKPKETVEVHEALLAKLAAGEVA